MTFALFAFPLLIIGHVLADWLFQPPSIAAGKRLPQFWARWRYLGAHGAVHGFFVSLVLGPMFGAAEAVAHAAIDRAKGRHLFGNDLDQVLHVICKVLWVAGASYLHII